MNIFYKIVFFLMINNTLFAQNGDVNLLRKINPSEIQDGDLMT